MDADHELLERLVREHGVPPDQRFALLHKVRYVFQRFSCWLLEAQRCLCACRPALCAAAQGDRWFVVALIAWCSPSAAFLVCGLSNAPLLHTKLSVCWLLCSANTNTHAPPFASIIPLCSCFQIRVARAFGGDGEARRGLLRTRLLAFYVAFQSNPSPTGG